MNQFTLDFYSIKINSKNNNITITPLIDVIDGEPKQNYAKKSCPLSINSYFLNTQPKLEIKNKEESIFYLGPIIDETLSLSYKVDKVLNDSFIALHFLFNDKSNFIIDVEYTNIKDKKTLTKFIENTNNIFLTSEFLLYDNITFIGGNLVVNIKNIDKNAINLHFIIIEKDTISLLEKDSLNFGFLTTKTSNQFYYTEVFEGEEGELMLHNKRFYGVLYGKIIDKNKIEKNAIYNISTYPKNEPEDDYDSLYLEYGKHNLE